MIPPTRAVTCAFVLFLVASLTQISYAADHYLCSGATGTHDGSSWTDAYTGFGTSAGQAKPSSLVRGDTYWIAAGNVAPAGVVFNTPVSGTSVITIKAATDAAHGASSTGWTNSGGGTCHQGQATFRALVQFLTSYWTLDGSYRSTATGNPWIDWRSGYGFFINNNAGSGNAFNPNQAILAGDGSYSTTVNNITLKYLEISGSHSITGTPADTCIHMQTGTPNAAQQNPYIGYSWCHETGNAWWTIDGGNNFTLEYTWAQNNLTSSASHGEGVQLRCAGPASSNYILRYNYFENGAGTGVLATPCTTDINPSNWAVYGNVFFDNLAEGINPSGYGAGNGAMALWNFLHWTGYLYIYNNTFSTLNPSGSGQCDIELDINNQGATMGTVAIENNVWYNCATQVSRPVCPRGGCTSFTVDHNSYFNTATNDSGTFSAQIASGNPFVNVARVSNANNFQLAADTFAWNPLSSPYNLDLDQLARTSSRGSFQFGSGSQLPQPPTGLAAVVQ